MKRTIAALAWTALLTASGLAADLVAMTRDVAAKEGVPGDLIVAIVRHESGFNPKARGKQGEIGLVQIKCGTAKGIGYRGTCAQLYDPRTNLTYGARYLRAALERTSGDWCKAASLYQAGLGARPRASKYCHKVMASLASN